MLQQLTVDEVTRIVDLARRTEEAQRRLVAGMRNIDLGGQPQERGSRNPSDLDTLAVLDQTVATAEWEALRDALGSLPEEARQELKALMLIGRGDFAANEWGGAMAEAARTPASADVDFVAERLTLGDYLSKGLYLLKAM